MTSTGKYAPVNGLNMYYEVHGSGRPLLMLHGAYMTIDMSGELIDGFAKTHQVIAVELQGHGRTADIDRPIRYELMADDCAAFLKHLGIGEPVDVYGYSMGAGVAIQLAIRHPSLVRRQVVASVSVSAAGSYPELWAMMETFTPEMLAGTPFETEYLKLAPRPEDFSKLVSRMVDLDKQKFDWSEDVAKITAPTLIILGDADIVRPEHAVEMLRALGGGIIGMYSGSPKAQLAIFPNTSHLGMLERNDLLLKIVPEFLNAPDPEDAPADVPGGEPAMPG